MSSNVTSIESSAFDDCTNLTTIAVTAASSSYSSVDGVLFNKSQTKLIRYPPGKTGSYTIPDSVTNIGDAAFGGCRELTNVTINNGVADLGDWVFCGCNSLTDVTVPRSVTNLGRWTFVGCVSLTGVYFQGNTPIITEDWTELRGTLGLLSGATNATVYYLSETTGWDTTFAGRPTAPWELAQTHDVQPHAGL